MRVPSRFVSCLCLFFVACSTTNTNNTTTDSTSSNNATNALAQTQKALGYIVVHRNDPLFLQPDEDAPYVQHMSDKEQQALERKLAQEARRRRLEAEKKARLKREREVARAKALAKKKKTRRRYKKRRKKKKLTAAQRQAIAEAKKARLAKIRRKKAIQKLRQQVKKVERQDYIHPREEMIVLKVLGKKDGWFKVQTLSPAEEAQHCWAGALSPLQPAKLTFYLPTTSAQTVLTRMERFEIYRGTEAKFQPGTVLKRNAKGTYTAHVDGFDVELDVPADVIDVMYRHPRIFEAPESDTVFKPEAYSEKLLKIDKKQRLPYSPFYDLFVVRTGKSSRYQYGTIQTPCAELTVMHPPEMTEYVTRRRTKRISGAKRTLEAPFARANVALYTKSGQRIGATAGKMPLGQPSGQSQGRSCFKQILWPKYDKKSWRTLDICVKPDDIVSIWP